MDVSDLALVLTSIGGAVLVPKMFAAVWQAITGRATRNRREIDRVRAEAAESERRAAAAERRADDEAYRRRVAQEHASHCRRLLYEAPCVDPSIIPPYPTTTRRDYSDE
jgi:hypothetical protein